MRRRETGQVQLAGFEIDFLGQIRFPFVQLAGMQIFQKKHVAATLDHDLKLRGGTQAQVGRQFRDLGGFRHGRLPEVIQRGQFETCRGSGGDQRLTRLLPCGVDLLELSLDVAQVSVEAFQLGFLQLDLGATPIQDPGERERKPLHKTFMAADEHG